MSLLCLGPLLLVAAAQDSPAPPADPRSDAMGAIDAIVDEALARGEAWRMLEELCTRAPHRLSGSDGAARAVQFASETLTAAGLEYVRLEPCHVPRWER